MGSHGCEHPADKVGRDDPDGDTTCWECGEVLNEAGADVTDAWNTRPGEDAARREGAEAMRQALYILAVCTTNDVTAGQIQALDVDAVLGGDDGE